MIDSSYFGPQTSLNYLGPQPVAATPSAMDPSNMSVGPSSADQQNNGFFGALGKYFQNRAASPPPQGGGGTPGGADYSAPAAGAHEALKNLAGAAGLTTGSAMSGAAAGAAGGGASGILSSLGGF